MIPFTRRASIKGTQTKEASFVPQIAFLENIIVLMCQYDAAKTEVVPYKVYDLTHYYQTGLTFGFNSQMYVVHRKVWLETGGAVQVKAIPISAPTGVAATGNIVTITGASTEAGAIDLYVHGERFSVGVASGAAASDVGDDVATALKASSDIVFDTSTITNTAGVISGTVSYTGLSGNDVRITGPKDTDSATPAGLTVVLADPTTGAGDEETVLQSAYDAMIVYGVWTTDIITPSNTTAALDLALTNIGLPEDGTSKGSGLWADDDYRPCTNWVGIVDTYSNSAALAANREEDMNNVIVAAPDRMELPYVIAAVSCAKCAALWNSNPARAPRGTALTGVDEAVDAANDWTRGANGNNQVDTALKAGLTTLRTDSSGNSILGDVATTYRPVTPEYPTWQFEVNKRKAWNIGNSLKNDKDAFDNGVFVESVEEAPDQPLARDAASYEKRVVGLAILWQRYGWAYNSAFTITNMVIEIGEGGNPDRIGRYIPVVLSGNARVQSDTVLIDRNLEAADLTGISINVA